MVHGDNGLGNAQFPPPAHKPAGDDAVAFLRDELLAAPEPVTLIGLAPLTNLALLFQSAPEVKSKIRKLALMGGAVEGGNATAVAEFNIYHDPEAADIVFNAGVPILMYGLDVFRRVCFSHDEVDRHFASRHDLASLPYPESAADLAGHLFHFFINNFGRSTVSIGDAGCVGAVIDPAGLTTEMLPVYVETGGRYSRGQTIVDRRPKDLIEPHAPGENDPYSEVILDIDEAFYRDMFRETVGLSADAR
jgi:pyrimidine-specific ribonucleoside hydrolase